LTTELPFLPILYIINNPNINYYTSLLELKHRLKRIGNSPEFITIFITFLSVANILDITTHDSATIFLFFSLSKVPIKGRVPYFINFSTVELPPEAMQAKSLIVGHCQLFSSITLRDKIVVSIPEFIIILIISE